MRTTVSSSSCYCMVRHEEADIMLSSYMLHAVREGTLRVGMLRDDTYDCGVFWCADTGRIMCKQMSSFKTWLVSSSVITLL